MNILKFLAHSLGRRLSANLAPRSPLGLLASGVLLDQEARAEQPVRRPAINRSVGSSTQPSIKASGDRQTLWPMAPATPRIVLRGVL